MKNFLRFALGCLCALTLFTGCVSQPEHADVEDTPYSSISHFVAMGDPQKAIDQYEKSFKENKEDPKTKLLHARLLLYAGKTADAEKELLSLLAQDPRNTEILFSLALAYGLTGKRDKQKETLETVIKLDGKSMQALSLMGEIWLEEKNLDKAQEYFDKTLKVEDTQFVALMGKGNVLLRKKDYAGAKELFDKAVAKDPQYPFAYVDRAVARRALKDRTGAIEDLTEAIRIDPEYSFSYLDRGKLYLDAGKKDAALADFKRAIGLDPDYFLSYVYAGGIYYERKAWDEAALCYRKVLEVKPSYYYIYEPLGVIHFMKEEWKAASDMFRTGYEYQKAQPAYCLLAALALKKNGRVKEADNYLQTAVKDLEPESWQWHMARYYMEPANDYYVIKAADKEKNKLVKAQILFYIAGQYLVSGKMVNSAKTYLMEMLSLDRTDLPEWTLADWEMNRLTTGIK